MGWKFHQKKRKTTEQKLWEIASGIKKRIKENQEGRDAKRKEIWMKGVGCPPSQVASQIAAL